MQKTFPHSGIDIIVFTNENSTPEKEKLWDELNIEIQTFNLKN